MIRMTHAYGLTPEEKYQYISAFNFDEEGSTETAKELLENEGEKIGDLVAILKDEALEDDKAIEEIAEATDVDANIIKDAAETKMEADAEGDAADASKEEKQEYFSALWRKRMWDSISFSINRMESEGYSPFLALFSEETVAGEEANEDKDTVEAIKIVKYVDTDAIADEGAEEVADIIAEATDGDKDAIQEVVEEKAKTVTDTAEAVSAYFSEVMAEMAAVAGVNEQEAVQETLAALEQQAEAEARAIEGGENFLRTNYIHQQQAGETPAANTDPMNMIKLPEDLASKINSDVNQSYKLSNVPNALAVPNVAPGDNFSRVGFNYKQPAFNNMAITGNGNQSLERMPGAPETMWPVLQGVNFSEEDANAVATVASMISTASMILNR